MTSSAQLSSVRTSLEELTAKVSGMAEQLSGTERDDVAVALFDVERALAAAGRRLDRVVEQLR